MASKRRLKRKQCSSKVAYTTEKAALDVKFAMLRQGKDYGQVFPYKCSYCGKFHLGHKPKALQVNHLPSAGFGGLTK